MFTLIIGHHCWRSLFVLCKPGTYSKSPITRTVDIVLTTTIMPLKELFTMGHSYRKKHVR